MVKLRNKEQVIEYLRNRDERIAASGEQAYHVADAFASATGVYPDAMVVDGDGFWYCGFRFRFSTSPFVPDGTVVASVTSPDRSALAAEKPWMRESWPWYVNSPQDLLRLLESQTPYDDRADWRDWHEYAERQRARKQAARIAAEQAAMSANPVDKAERQQAAVEQYQELRELSDGPTDGPVDRPTDKPTPWVSVPTDMDAFVIHDAGTAAPKTERRRRADVHKPRPRRADLHRRRKW